METRIIDARSDTATRPTPAMMEAIGAAALGDEILGEDLTVNRLQELAAELLGKEAALFTTSGTMSNQIAVMALARRGDEVIVGSRSHIYNLETGGLAALSQVQARPLEFPDGYADPALVAAAIRQPGVQNARTGLICLENTYDLNRGCPVTAENTREICELAQARGITVYLDGARLFNAAVALNTTAKELARPVDAVQVCLTKGLGAPYGAVLAGGREFIAECRRLKQRLGGGLRQAGIVAAPGVVALESMVGRLAEDHENAAFLARELHGIEPSLLDPAGVHTNAVNIDISGTGVRAEELLAGLERAGIRIKQVGPVNFRLMTHLNVRRPEVDKILAAVRSILKNE